MNTYVTRQAAFPSFPYPQANNSPDRTKHNSRCDDGTLPPDSELANWGQKFEAFGKIINLPFNVFDTMRSSTEGAGFVKIHEKVYKVPIGDWPRHPVYKDAERLKEVMLTDEQEGFAMMLFTSVGEKPWTHEEVQAYLAKMRKELGNRDWHQDIRQPTPCVGSEAI